MIRDDKLERGDDSIEEVDCKRIWYQGSKEVVIFLRDRDW